MDSALRDLAPLAPPLVYVIDGQDRFHDCNDAYVADAAEGRDPASVREALIGKLLWRLLPAAAEWYGPLVRRARDEQREICFPFRCDTPDLRRLMRMRLQPGASSHVTFESAIVAVQPRPRVAILDAPVDGAQVTVTMCSWCKRVDAGATWLEVEAALEHVADATGLPALSHGICPRCLGELTALAQSPDARLSIGLPESP